MFKQSYLHIPLLCYSVHIINFSWKKITRLAYEWSFIFGCDLNNYACKNVLLPNLGVTACSMPYMCMFYSVIQRNLQNILLWISCFYLYKYQNTYYVYHWHHLLYCKWGVCSQQKYKVFKWPQGSALATSKCNGHK